VLLAPDVARALERTAAPFEEASPLPRAALVEPAFFELDLRLFEASWVPVAHESELARPGQMVAVDLAGTRVVAARGADLELHAFQDRCAHRGVPLTAGDRATCASLELVCPYHGLRYDLTGRALSASVRALGLEGDVRLPQVRVARWNGFVFVCLSPRAPALAEHMGPVPPWLPRASLHALRLGRRRVHEVRASWKLCAANFQESHHFPHVHPALEAITPWSRSTSEIFAGAWLGGTMEIADGAETVSEDTRIAGRPLVAHEEDARHVHDALLVPAWMTSLQPDYFLSYRLLPIAPDRTTVIADIYFHEAAGATDTEPGAVYAFWDRTNAEDRAICELQQRGVNSPHYRPGPYARSEDGQHAFEQRLARYYLASAQEGSSSTGTLSAAASVPGGPRRA
jgi:Rieske 2Fe-2S family protein